MKDSDTCPKCRSTELIHGLGIPDHYDYGVAADVKLRTFENPEALLFKGAKSSKLLAHVCGSCGYTELYVENPRLLWNAYRGSR